MAMEKVNTTSKPTQPNDKISIVSSKQPLQNQSKTHHSSNWYTVELTELEIRQDCDED
jgi:hypothetical protein